MNDETFNDPNSEDQASGIVAFLNLILPMHGHLVGFVKKGEIRRQQAFETPEQLIAWQRPYDLEGFDCYQCCSTIIDPTRRKGLRAGDNIHASGALWFEVDSRSSKTDAYYKDRFEADAATREFLHKAKLPRPVWACSGGGPQIYLPFDAELPPDQWLELARGLRGACDRFNFHADSTRTCDVTSILRTPGTHHHKSGRPILLRAMIAAPHALEAYEHLRQYAGAKRSSVPVSKSNGGALASEQTYGRHNVGAAARADLKDPAPPETLQEIAKLRSTFPYLDPSNYEDWFRFLCGLKSTGWSEESVLNLADELSQNTTRGNYPGRDGVRDKLAKIHADRTKITERSLYDRAMNKGWHEPLMTADAPAQPQSRTVAWPASTAQAQTTLKSVRASTIEPAAIDWLWLNRFALGKLGIVAGLPGEGKGQIFAYMAARVTRGLDWPCGEGHAPQGNVLMLSAEDDASDTLIPRLIAASADLEHIEILNMVREPNKERMFNLASDLALLRQKIAEVGNVKLVLIDPISAYLGIGKVDSFRTTDVRAVLAPLVELASDLKVAVIGIMHFNKKVDVTNALLRISDSLAFGATARHVYAVVDDPENKRKLFVKGKNNLARDTQALAYNISVGAGGKDRRTAKQIEAPFVEWHAYHVDVTASEALQAATENKAPAARDAAKKFLMNLLAAGPVTKKEIEDAANGNGISTRTLERAKRELEIIAKKDAPDGGWTWRLPVPAHPTTTSRH